MGDKITLIHSLETEDQAACVKEQYAKYPKENNKRFAFKLLDDEDQSVGHRLMAYVNTDQKKKVDLFVTGLYGRTYEQYEKNEKKHHVGSKSDLSLRATQCPSLFVRREVPIPDGQNSLKIVVGVDGSQNSQHAFQFATRLLEPGNTLHVVHIETEFGNNKSVPDDYLSANVIKNYKQFIEEKKKELGFKVNMNIHLIEDTVKISDALCSFAEKNGCQVLCVGADGMTAWVNKQPIIGSVSDECVKDCKCNVIVSQINEVSTTPRGSF